jgi:hypothetical protein
MFYVYIYIFFLIFKFSIKMEKNNPNYITGSGEEEEIIYRKKKNVSIVLGCVCAMR